MAKKTKSSSDRSTATIDLGKVRKAKIRQYRAKKELDGTPVLTLEAAVNQLLDRALQLEQA